MRKKLTKENLAYWTQYIADVKAGILPYSIRRDVPETIMRALRYDTSGFADQRTRRGYTQKEVASWIGVSVRNYRRWEQRTASPSLAHRRALEALFAGEAPNPLTSEQILALRLDRGYTRAQLARVVGVTPTTVQRWEEGRSIPRPDSAEMLRILKNREKSS